MSTGATISPLATLSRLCGFEPTRARPPVTMVVLAHPDDESVGAASLLPALRSAHFVYVTDGSPRALRDARAAGCASRDAYAQLRRGELASAFERLGIAATRVEHVGFVDQEASAHLAPLTLWLEILLRETWPSLVLTHPYEGGHPDHDAVAFAVHAARSRLVAAGEPAPVIAEFTSYHAHGDDWVFGDFIPASGVDVITRELTPDERRAKRLLLGCYASQRAVLRHACLETERFRVAPAYDFTAPPHPGPLLYERFGWGWSGRKWRALAQSALAEVQAATKSWRAEAQALVATS